jgi:pyridoxal phosphate enzyme (YggS family)
MTTAELTLEAYAARLERTLPEVRERIAHAAREAGRSPSAVRLVAVTKGHPLEAVDAALAAGLADLGENRVEELERRVASRAGVGIVWHMIGHVQSRKARRAAEVAHLIHSVDSYHLAERLARVGRERAETGSGAEVAVLAQVNTSGEPSKSGLPADGAVDEVCRIAELPGLRLEGLMTMAPLVDDEAVLRATFSRLREIHERARRASDRVGSELSMGMTNDLEVAIREGSTIVRIGTALFGERPGGGQ